MCAASSLSPLRVECLDPRRDPAWLALLRHPAAGLFHSPPWLCALSDAYGFDIRAYLVRDAAGEPLGGVAFCELDDACGRRLVVLPFSDECAPLAASTAAWQALFCALQSHNVPIHLRRRTDSAAPVDRGLTVTKTARWHRLSLSTSPDSLWMGLAGATRRAIRKAMRLGVQIRPLENAAGLDAFFRLHVATRKRKYRLLAQPAAFFQAIARRFSETHNWFPLGAYLGDRLIAATVYLRWRDRLYYKFNASDLDALEARPNNLLGWAGLSLARSLGCEALDFGPSDDDQPGLIRFKSNFGAAVSELRFLSFTPSDWRDDRAVAVRRLLSEMTTSFTAPEVSDEIAARAGSVLYRYFT